MNSRKKHKNKIKAKSKASNVKVVILTKIIPGSYSYTSSSDSVS